MQVAAGQDGIQRLLAAEKEAQQIVAKARKGTLVVILWFLVLHLAFRTEGTC